MTEDQGGGWGQRFPRSFWMDYLERADRELHEPLSLLLVGGGAISLKYSGHYQTQDLDCVSVVPAEADAAFRKAATQLQAEFGLREAPHFGYTSVLDAPYTYEERLQRLDAPELKNIQIYVPERHDLALMKTARGDEKDRVGIREVHRENPLDLPTLVDHYAEMMFVGDAAKFRVNLHLTVADLWGDRVAEALLPQLERLDATPGHGTPDERKRVAIEALWTGALGAELEEVHKRAAALEARIAALAGDVARQRQEHALQRPQEPGRLAALLAGKDALAEFDRRLAKWTRDDQDLAHRQRNLQDRAALAHDWAKHPVKSARLAEARVSRENPGLAAEVTQVRAVHAEHQQQRQVPELQRAPHEKALDRDRER